MKYILPVPFYVKKAPATASGGYAREEQAKRIFAARSEHSTSKSLFLKSVLLCFLMCLFVSLCLGGAVALAAAKPDANRTARSKGLHPKSLDWYSDGKRLVVKNKNITIYDVNTGVTWHATYINGRNHADIIPASAADARKIASHKIVGKSARRPVIAIISGTAYAGSMYAVAHGKTNYCNYFNGVMCLHFTGSKTHGTQKVDPTHQRAIRTALGIKMK